jgi:hypothetical protein
MKFLLIATTLLISSHAHGENDLQTFIIPFLDGGPDKVLKIVNVGSTLITIKDIRINNRNECTTNVQVVLPYYCPTPKQIAERINLHNIETGISTTCRIVPQAAECAPLDPNKLSCDASRLAANEAESKRDPHQRWLQPEHMSVALKTGDEKTWIS